MGDDEGSGRFSGRKGAFAAIAAVAIVIMLVMAGVTFEARDEPGEDRAGEGGAMPLLVADGSLNVNVQDGPYGTNEPSVAVNPDDPMHAVAGANDYNTPLADSWVGTYVTYDGGKSWQKNFVPGYPGGPYDRGLSGFKGAGDPVAAFGTDGECYMAGIAFVRKHVPLTRFSCIFVARSDNGGKDFDDVNIVIKSQTQGVFHDKEWIAVDPNTGDVYVSWTIFYAMGAVGSQIVVSRSSDRGDSWSVPTVVSEMRQKPDRQVQGSYIQVDDEGVVHLTWIDYFGKALRYARSYDRGNSFEEHRAVASVTVIPSPLDNVVHRTPTMPTMALDMTGGEYHGSVYISWPDARTGDADILLIVSRDRGDTWSSEIRVNDDEGTADQFFPSICTDSDGNVYAFFYDRRRDGNNTFIDAFWAVSTDGGMNFTHQFNVTTEMFNGNAGGGSFIGQFTDGAFIGDYLQIAVGPKIYKDGREAPDPDDGGSPDDDDGEGHFRTYMFWCDTRNGNPEDKNSDLYCARVEWPSP